MGLLDWLFDKKETTSIFAGVEVKKPMEFKPFVEKYWGTLAVGSAANIEQTAKAEGMTVEQVTEYVMFCQQVQKQTVSQQNRMPTKQEIITAWNAVHGIVETTPAVPVGPAATTVVHNPTQNIASIFNRVAPVQEKTVGLLPISEAEAWLKPLIKAIVKEAVKEALEDQDVLVAPTKQTVNVAIPTYDPAGSILTWPFQKVIEWWDVLAHKS